MKAPAKRGGRAAQDPSSEASKSPKLQWDTTRRKDEREIRSEIRGGHVILGPSLFFRCSSTSSGSCSAFLSRGFHLHLHEDIQSDGLARKWMNGFVEYLSIFSRRSAACV